MEIAKDMHRAMMKEVSDQVWDMSKEAKKNLKENNGLREKITISLVFDIDDQDDIVVTPSIDHQSVSKTTIRLPQHSLFRSQDDLFESAAIDSLSRAAESRSIEKRM